MAAVASVVHCAALSEVQRTANCRRVHAAKFPAAGNSMIVADPLPSCVRESLCIIQASRRPRDLRQRRGQNRRRRRRKCFAAAEAAVLRTFVTQSLACVTWPQAACPLTEVQETETAALREATFWSQNDPTRTSGLSAFDL